MDEVRTRCGIYSDQQQSEVKFPLKIDHVSQYLSNQFLLSEDSIDEKLSALALLARGCVLYEEISFNSSSSSSANSSGNSGAATIYIPVIPPFQRLKGFSDTDINLEFRGYAMEVTFNSTSDRALFLDRYILGKTENRRSSSSLQRRHLVSAVAEAAFSDTSKSKPFPYHKGEENTVLIQQSTAQIIPEICNCLENWFTHERSDLEYNNEDISNSCVRYLCQYPTLTFYQLTF